MKTAVKKFPLDGQREDSMFVTESYKLVQRMHCWPFAKQSHLDLDKLNQEKKIGNQRGFEQEWRYVNKSIWNTNNPSPAEQCWERIGAQTELIEEMCSRCKRIWITNNHPLEKILGLNRDLNPGPPAPEAGIIPLDHWARLVQYNQISPSAASDLIRYLCWSDWTPLCCNFAICKQTYKDARKYLSFSSFPYYIWEEE